MAENVLLDSASAYQWEALNETVFLKNFFKCLSCEMGNDFSRYTYYIFSSHEPSTVPHSADNRSRNKILFFISDESASIPVALRENYFAIFKGYMPYEMAGSNVFPFNIGYAKDVPGFKPPPIRARPIDVFFSGNLNDNRIAFYSALHPILRHLPQPLAAKAFNKYRHRLRTSFEAVFPHSSIQFTNGFKHGLSPECYGDLLCKSKIVLCPKGFRSPETFRHIEAMRAGAVVLSEELPDTHFYRGSPIVTIANWREGLRTARKLLADPDNLIRLQKQTSDWWRNVCSEAATASFVASQIQLLRQSL